MLLDGDDQIQRIYRTWSQLPDILRIRIISCQIWILIHIFFRIRISRLTSCPSLKGESTPPPTFLPSSDAQYNLHEMLILCSDTYSCQGQSLYFTQF